MRNLSKYTLALSLFAIFGCNQNSEIHLFPISQYGKFGFINAEGEEIIPCKYDDVCSFTDGLVTVKCDGYWGVINTADSLIVDFEYKYRPVIKNGIIRGTLKKLEQRKYLYHTYDLAGNRIVPEYDSIHIDFRDTLFGRIIKEHGSWTTTPKTGKQSSPNETDPTFWKRIYHNEKLGYINTKHDTVIPCKYSWVSSNGFEHGVCGVVEDSIWGYINTKGAYIWKQDINNWFERNDLSQWSLDTMELCYPNPCFHLPAARSREMETDTLYWGMELFLDTTYTSLHSRSSYIPFGSWESRTSKNAYHAYKLYLNNYSDDIVGIMTQGGRIKIYQQALSEDNRWINIAQYYDAWCGNSYSRIWLYPACQLVFQVPIFKGNIKTKLRFAMQIHKTTYYSNAYDGWVNHEQFNYSFHDYDLEIENHRKVYVYGKPY